MDLASTSRTSTARTPPTTTSGIPSSTNPTTTYNHNLIIRIPDRGDWEYYVYDLPLQKYYLLPLLTPAEYHQHVISSTACHLHSLCYGLDAGHPLVQFVNNPFARLRTDSFNVTFN